MCGCRKRCTLTGNVISVSYKGWGTETRINKRNLLPYTHLNNICLQTIHSYVNWENLNSGVLYEIHRRSRSSYPYGDLEYEPDSGLGQRNVRLRLVGTIQVGFSRLCVSGGSWYVYSCLRMSPVGDSKSPTKNTLCSTIHLYNSIFISHQLTYISNLLPLGHLL